MASILQRKIGPVGSTGMITLWGVGTGATYEFTGNSMNDEEVRFVPQRIVKVINMTGANVTIDGNTYATGQWNLDQTPVPCSADITGAITGNVVVQLVGYFEAV